MNMYCTRRHTKLTKFTEQAWEKNSSNGFIKELLADREAIIIELRERINLFTDEYKDAVTSDFIYDEDYSELQSDSVRMFYNRLKYIKL
jgi:DNA-binding ferritin-like protein